MVLDCVSERTLLQCGYRLVTDRISEGGKANASVRLFSLYFQNRLTVDLELLHVNSNS